MGNIPVQIVVRPDVCGSFKLWMFLCVLVPVSLDANRHSSFIEKLVTCISVVGVH